MRVVIVGAGGHGRVVLDILRASKTCDPLGFLDADPNLAGTTIDGVPILGSINLLPKLRRQGVSGAIIAIGDSRARRHYAQLLAEQDLELINAVHPKSFISPRATLGRGIVVAALAAVGTDSRLDDLVIVNTGGIVEHECEVGKAVHICPGARLAGRVHVGDGAFIGLGANIIQCLTIGEGATVGAGAVVLQDVEAFTTVVGIPAKTLPRAASVRPGTFNTSTAN